MRNDDSITKGGIQTILDHITLAVFSPVGTAFV